MHSVMIISDGVVWLPVKKTVSILLEKASHFTSDCIERQFLQTLGAKTIAAI